MTIELTRPRYFNFAECRRFLNRSDHECTHLVTDDKLYKWIEYEGRPLLFSVSNRESHLSAEILLGIDEAAPQRVKREILHWLDLERDLEPFYQLAQSDPILSPLAHRYQGLRLIGLPDLFEALSWAIIGQQINLRFAYSLKRRLVEHFGAAFTYRDQPFYLFPRPGRIASLEVADFQALQFSRSKAEYLIGVARQFVSGALSYSTLDRLSYNDSHQRLVSIRGIGPWTADYVLMKCFRHPEAFPIGDVGLHNAIKYLLDMDRKPRIDEIEQMAQSWGAWKAYATFYLWHSLLDYS